MEANQIAFVPSFFVPKNPSANQQKKFKGDKMKTITYVFCDGTSNTVEVTDEFYNLFIELEKELNRSNRKETRRHISISVLIQNGIDISEDQPSDYGDLLDAISKLLPSQQELIRKIYFDGYSANEIAKKEGVDKSAISKRLSRIYDQLKKIMSTPSTLGVSRGYKCRHDCRNHIGESNDD